MRSTVTCEGRVSASKIHTRLFPRVARLDLGESAPSGPERELEGLPVRTLGLSRPGAGNVGGERRDPDKYDQHGNAYLCELFLRKYPRRDLTAVWIIAEFGTT